jgi:hypothetical protein
MTDGKPEAARGRARLACVHDAVEQRSKHPLFVRPVCATPVVEKASRDAGM